MPPFRGVHQRRRPFDGVDFGDEGGVHEARLLEQPFAIGRGIFDAQPIHDRIVLAREQRVQHRNPTHQLPFTPESSRFARSLVESTGRWPCASRWIFPSGRNWPLAGSVRTSALPREVGAVELRAVPPMGLGVAIGCGLALIRRAAPVVRQRAQDRHVGRRPVIAGRQRQLMRRRSWCRRRHGSASRAP